MHLPIHEHKICFWQSYKKSAVKRKETGTCLLHGYLQWKKSFVFKVFQITRCKLTQALCHLSVMIDTFVARMKNQKKQLTVFINFYYTFVYFLLQLQLLLLKLQRINLIFHLVITKYCPCYLLVVNSHRNFASAAFELPCNKS